MEKWRFSKGVDPFSLYVRAADIYYAPTRLGDKAACFIALAHGSDEISEGGWGDRFNLHLDLMQKGDRYIPIIIDPDIGHPGGHRP